MADAEEPADDELEISFVSDLLTTPVIFAVGLVIVVALLRHFPGLAQFVGVAGGLLIIGTVGWTLVRSPLRVRADAQRVSLSTVLGRRDLPRAKVGAASRFGVLPWVGGRTQHYLLTWEDGRRTAVLPNDRQARELFAFLGIPDPRG